VYPERVRPRRLAAAFLLVAIAALVGALSAAAKDGVRATLSTSIPLDAKPGTRLDVAWTLASATEGGRRQPFGARGVFVRLLSASGAEPEIGDAYEDAKGAYTARVEVPAGGIGDVEIGIHALTSNGPSALLFPISNDPVPGARHLPTTASTSEAGSSRAWIVVLVAGSLFAATLALTFGRPRLFGRRTPAER
jgi:hypothetical protein